MVLEVGVGVVEAVAPRYPLPELLVLLGGEVGDPLGASLARSVGYLGREFGSGFRL